MKGGPRAASTLAYALVAAVLLSACGFRPRGVAALPEDFRNVYVQAPVEITDELAVFLESGGASVVETQDAADALIRVGAGDYDQRVVTVDATTGKAREYELLYTFDFSVRMRDGTMLIPTEHLVIRRIYIFDPNAVIGATQNVESLKQDMRRDAAQRIIRLTETALGE